VDEDLLMRFEDFALSPQVVCTSPRPAAKTAASFTCLQPSPSISCSKEPHICPCSMTSETRDTASTPTSSASYVPRHAEATTTGDVADVTVTCLVSAQPFAPMCQWHQDLKSSPASPGKRCSKRVRFVEGPELISVHRICTWSFAYKAARKGPWEQMARDRAHFRRKIESVALVLEPCLAARSAARTNYS